MTWHSWHTPSLPVYKANYFRYAPSIKLSEARCLHCEYVPDMFVDNPMKCLRDHIRRVHREIWMREYRRIYIIQEYP